MKTVILDGNNALWRLMARLPELKANGKPIQVVYGFLRLLRSCLNDFSPDVALVCWDTGHSRYRLELYPEYKADRKKKDPKVFEQANSQLKMVKDILKYLNVSQLEYPQTEADDLIGIACAHLSGKKIIISSDRDMLHLVSDDVSVWSPIKTLLYTKENFRKEVGMSPKQWLELRAITGDSGDNISGAVKGLGEETARELIVRFKDIETLFSHAVEKKVAKMGNRYALLYSEGARERVFRNLLLMDLTLPADRPDYSEILKALRKDLEARKNVDKLFIRQYFKEQQFDSLLKDLHTWLLPFEDLDVTQ